MIVYVLTISLWINGNVQTVPMSYYETTQDCMLAAQMMRSTVNSTYDNSINVLDEEVSFGCSRHRVTIGD